MSSDRLRIVPGPRLESVRGGVDDGLDRPLAGADALRDVLRCAPLPIREELDDLSEVVAIALEPEAITVRPGELQRLAMTLGVPSGLLDEHQRVSVARCLDVEERVARALPRTRDRAALVLVV